MGQGTLSMLSKSARTSQNTSSQVDNAESMVAPRVLMADISSYNAIPAGLLRLSLTTVSWPWQIFHRRQEKFIKAVLCEVAQ